MTLPTVSRMDQTQLGWKKRLWRQAIGIQRALKPWEGTPLTREAEEQGHRQAQDPHPSYLETLMPLLCSINHILVQVKIQHFNSAAPSLSRSKPSFASLRLPALPLAFGQPFKTLPGRLRRPGGGQTPHHGFSFTPYIRIKAVLPFTNC